MHDLEAAADDARAAEVQRRTSSGVALVATSKSLGPGPISRCGHGAADDIGLVAVALQRFADAPATAADAVAGDAVVAETGNDGRFVTIGLGVFCR